MNPIEHLITALAPHTCLICGTEPQLLCLSCADGLRAPPLVLPSIDYLDSIWACGIYEGAFKELIAAIKFNRGKAAAPVLAELLDTALPYLPIGTIVSHVPTARSRIRSRGYDQAELIARAFARQRGLPYRQTLVRISNTRQVGANRKQRSEQMKHAFKLHISMQKPPASILLVDDVMTTGASLGSAAAILSEQRVKRVYAAVVAYQPK